MNNIIINNDHVINIIPQTGIYPMRQDIEVLPADEPKVMKLGWTITETIGIGIINPRLFYPKNFLIYNEGCGLVIGSNGQPDYIITSFDGYYNGSWRPAATGSNFR